MKSESLIISAILAAASILIFVVYRKRIVAEITTFNARPPALQAASDPRTATGGPAAPGGSTLDIVNGAIAVGAAAGIQSYTGIPAVITAPIIYKATPYVEHAVASGAKSVWHAVTPW